jgi:iron-sulfur cluster repair protein YtfE (RIC family)
MTTCTLDPSAGPALRACITSDMTVEHVAARYPVTMRLFDACDIDTRRGRMLTLSDVADRLCLDVTELVRALARAAEDAASDWSARPALPLES